MSTDMQPISSSLSTLATSTPETGVTTGVEERIRPWERQPGESSGQHSYFKVYLEMDPPRSVRGAYLYWMVYIRRAEIPKTGMDRRWWDYAKLFHWKERAEAWDAHQVELNSRRREKERLEAQRDRYELRTKAIERTHEMLDSSDPTNKDWIANFGRIVEAAMKLNEDSRKEYGDDIKRVEQTGAFTFAQLVSISGFDGLTTRDERSVPAPPPIGSGAGIAAIPENTPIDAEFTEIPQPAPYDENAKKSIDLESQGGMPQPAPENSSKIENVQTQQRAIPTNSKEIQNDLEEVGEDLAESLEYLAVTYTPQYGEPE